MSHVYHCKLSESCYMHSPLQVHMNALKCRTLGATLAGILENTRAIETLTMRDFGSLTCAIHQGL